MTATRKLIKIEPLDTLFFRDHRPFSAGEDVYAESVLPSPLVIYGAIGDYILKCQNKTIKDFYASKNDNLGLYQEQLSNLDLAKIKIKGIFLFHGDKILLPIPANIFDRGTRKPKEFTYPKCNYDKNKFKWDIAENIAPISYPQNEDSKQINGYMEIEDINYYLKNDLHGLRNKEVCIYREGINNLYVFETRYGNELSKGTMTVEHLYRLNHIRFRDFIEYKKYNKNGFAVLLDGLKLENENVGQEQTLAIGGEKRRAKITINDDKGLESLRDAEILGKIKDSKRFFLYFATPAIFKNGWISDCFVKKLPNTTLNGAILNKPIYISGWVRETESKGHPRPIRKAVPAGSVYFFTANDSCDLDEIYNKYNINESLSDEYPVAGFGITAIGVW